MCESDKMPLISVIVPVFNVESYIERCIQSLIAQSYVNIEIIIVDDGSTDNSGKICDMYGERDLRVKVIHKLNGGLADARNVGIREAAGEYIAFTDSDDWVAENYISELYKLLIQTDSDIAVCKFKRVSNEGEILLANSEEYQIYSNEDAIKQLLYQKISSSACGKLYKIDLWDEVRFPIQKLYEDVEPVYYVFRKCERVVCTNKILYLYFYRKSSIVNQKFTIRKMDYVENCKKLLENIKVDYPQFENAAISRLMWAEVHVLVHMDAPKKYLNEYTMLMNDIKKFRFFVMRDRNNKLKTRSVALLSCLGYMALKAVFRLARAGALIGKGD